MNPFVGHTHYGRQTNPQASKMNTQHLGRTSAMYNHMQAQCHHLPATQLTTRVVLMLQPDILVIAVPRTHNDRQR